MAQQTRTDFTTGLGVEIADINTKITTNITANGVRAITGTIDAMVRQDEKVSLNTLFTNIKDSAFLPLTDNTDVITLEGATNLWFTNARARTAISETITGIDYNSTTGVFSLTAGYVIPTTTEQTNWNTAYGNMINSASFAANTITLLQQDTGTVTVAINLSGFTTDDLTASSTKRYLTGAIGASVTAPTGGATIDAESRTAINTIISRLVAAGVIS